MGVKNKATLLIGAGALKLIHKLEVHQVELEVHQVELELQSKELMREKEKAISISSEKYEELFDYAPSGYFTFTRNGEIIKVNLAGAKLLGGVRSHLVNSSFGFFLSADSRITFSAFLDAIFAGNGKLVCELSLSADFIVPVYILLTGILSEDPDLCRVIVSDVTAQKQLEQNLSDANKELVFQNKEKADWSAELKELLFAKNELLFQFEKEARLVAELAILNTEKDKFFSVIAHDLRGPFGSFLGLTTLLNENFQSMTMEETQELLLLLKKSATNLFSLLANLLEWSRMQRGLTSYNPSIIMLGSIITEIIEQGQETADKKYISVSKDIPADLKVFADLNMVMCIVRNLYSNAVKFTPKEGRILVSAKPVSKNWIEISIEDTGIGMGKTLLEDLFRISGNTGRKGTDDEPSTGLGLIICKDYIEKHRGILSVESQEGKGSIFRFTLPLSNEQDEKIVNLAEHYIKQKQKLKILIAEDDEISAQLILITLRPFSKELLIAQSGAEAVEICRNNPDIDLVLMDIKMPGLNGYEATREIRSFNTDMVIVGQSAYDDIVDHKTVLEIGWNDYIHKPFDPVMLRKMVQKYF